MGNQSMNKLMQYLDYLETLFLFNNNLVGTKPCEIFTKLYCRLFQNEEIKKITLLFSINRLFELFTEVPSLSFKHMLHLIS